MTERRTLRTHPQQAATRILESVPEESKHEIHLLAFTIGRSDADNRHPRVDVGHNTESKYEKEMRRESDSWEVRWNCAFWILVGFDKLGNVPEDPVGAPLYEEEARHPGIWYDGEFGLGRMLEDDGLRAKSGRLRAHLPPTRLN